MTSIFPILATKFYEGYLNLRSFFSYPACHPVKWGKLKPLKIFRHIKRKPQPGRIVAFLIKVSIKPSGKGKTSGL
jgi:hypothetical protein